jgi:lipopolysaccharide export system permease protein
VPIILLMTLLVAGFSFYFTPKGNFMSEKLFSQQESRNTFDLVKAGAFQRLGNNMLYARALSDDKSQLLDVTLYSQKEKADNNTQQTLLYAQRAKRYFDEKTGITYLELLEGRRYEFQPNQVAYNRIDFQRYKMRINTQVEEKEIKRARSFSTPIIYDKKSQGDNLAWGEWLWRCSLPLLIPTGFILALALARVNPRQGRYFKLLPAILLYVSLVVMIGAVRNKVEKGSMGQLAIWGVHSAYFALSIILLAWEDIKLHYHAWRNTQQGTSST